MRHPEFPVVSFLCIVLLFCVLPSHIRAGSICTLALIAWLAVMSIIRGVNSLIWANNFVVRLEVWCDISTKVTIGFTYAVPASALCILRHLENVASARAVRTTIADKQRRNLFEAMMCFGVPIIFMALHYIVQGHRFDIIEDVGCVPFVYFSVAAVLIVWVPPFLMSLTTFVYAALTLRHFLRRRIEFAAHLQTCQAAITPARYLRLMLLAIVEMVWDTGVNAYIIYFNTFTGLRPWISWDNVHSGFSRIGIFPEYLIPPQFVSQLIWQWWIVPVSCITFFIFFGSGEEAMSDYRTAFVWMRRNILRQNVVTKQTSSRSQSLPTHRKSTKTYNVALSSFRSSDSTSEHNAKPWDKLSFDQLESVTLPESPYLQPSDSAPHSQATLTVHSTTNLQRGGLSFGGESSQINVGYAYPSPVVGATPLSSQQGGTLSNIESPDLGMTQPGFVNSPLVGVATTSPSSQQLSASTSLPKHPTSTVSTDFEIAISETYIPDVASSSRYHEEAFLARDISYANSQIPLPHGGILMTVERYVV